jgi:putative transposase
MKRHKAFKFRLYPTVEQATLINKTIGCSRFVFNHFLASWNDAFKQTGKCLTYGTCSAQLPALKKEYEWLKGVDSIAIQTSVRNLADAFMRFFKKQNDRPRFKSKKNPVQSYTTKQTNGNIVEIQPLPQVKQNVGVDLGIKHFAILSNGEPPVENPKYLHRYESQLAR